MAISWSTAADWDAASFEDGVVHESVANTDHNDATSVKRGYSIESPYLSGSLDAYYPLHEDSGGTAYDFSGNGNDAVIYGATQGYDAPLGTTMYGFDGNSDYLDTGLNPDGGDLSISVWFEADAWGGSYHSLTAIENNSLEQLVFREDSSSNFDWAVYSGGYYGTDNLNLGNLADGEIHHMVGTYDNSSGSWTLYLDGSQVASASASFSYTSSIPFFIGAMNDTGSPTDYWNGHIWEMRYYNTELSSQNVQYLNDVVETDGRIITDWRSP